MATEPKDKTLTESSSDTRADSAGIRRIMWINFALIVLGVLISLSLKNIDITFSFLAGGLLTAINLWLIKLVVANLTKVDRTSRMKLAVQIVLKLFFGFGALFLLLWFFPLNTLAFLVGLSTLVLAITIEGILGLLRG